jgi:hypothetical protein
MQIKTILKPAAIVAIALLLLAAVLWAAARLMPLSAPQRAAIAMLEQTPEHEGGNAFGLLWTLSHAVPEDRIDAVLAEEARRITQFRTVPLEPGMNSEPVDRARDDYPELDVTEADRALFCGERDASCLARVENDPEAYRALIDRHAPRLQRIDALSDYGHLDQPWRYAFDASHTPPLAGLGDTRTRDALLFVEGRIDEALTHSCRAIDSWRRLGRSADSLILRLIANAYAIRHHGVQLAEMLARLPAEQSLPSICDQALTPPEPAELSLCNAMRGEFEVASDANRFILAANGDGLAGWRHRLGYDTSGPCG